MKYLFIDTCTSHLIVSTIIDNKIVSYFNEKIDKGMSNYILPEIEKQLKENNLEASSIDAIFVSNGPGSFTGIRVGLTISKVYAWSLNIKVIPISSLEVLASTKSSKNNLALMDARRGYVFLGAYDQDLNNIIKDSYVLYNEDNYKDYNIISYDNFNNSKEPNIDILKVINKHKNDLGINPHSLNPNYLKLTEAEEKLNDKRD